MKRSSLKGSQCTSAVIRKGATIKEQVLIGATLHTGPSCPIQLVLNLVSLRQIEITILDPNTEFPLPEIVRTVTLTALKTAALKGYINTPAGIIYFPKIGIEKDLKKLEQNTQNSH